MSIRKGTNSGQEGTRLAEAHGTTEVNVPRRMTFAENVILTLKVLAGFGLLGAALWGVSLWKASR